MTPVIKKIALQAGGSHYPTVGGELLQKFSDLLVLECVAVLKSANTSASTEHAELLLKHFNLK